MTRVYYADLYCHKARAQERRDQLNAIPGVKVVSTWMDEKHGATVQTKDLTAEEHIYYGTRDLDEICECDVLVLCQPEGDLHDYNITNLSRGGRHFEAGYAFALKKQVVIIGQRENIFHWQPKVRQFDTWMEFIARLSTAEQYKYVPLVNHPCHANEWCVRARSVTDEHGRCSSCGSVSITCEKVPVTDTIAYRFFSNEYDKWENEGGRPYPDLCQEFEGRH